MTSPIDDAPTIGRLRPFVCLYVCIHPSIHLNKKLFSFTNLLLIETEIMNIYQYQKLFSFTNLLLIETEIYCNTIKNSFNYKFIVLV